MASITPQRVQAGLASLRELCRRSMRLYVAGCSGEPLAVAEAMTADPELAADVTFLGVWIPGVNRTDWASLHPSARAETIFLSADLRASFQRGKTGFRPLSYSQAWGWLETTPLDAAIIMVSPPDATGEVSLGVSADFSPAVLARKDVVKAALINPKMPAPQVTPRLSLDAFDVVMQADHSLIEVPSGDLAPAYTRLAGHVVNQIQDEDTLQFGLGSVQQAVLEALGDHRNLALHAGMVSDPIVPLLKAGVFADKPGAVTTGVAIGTAQLYREVAHDHPIAFKPVSDTHAAMTLARAKRLKAINSVLQVDLLGQANAEFLNGRQISGTGGLVDFLRGAQASKGGRGIIALLSTARGGDISRIVPCLDAPAVSVARADVDLVVTEHGVADLRGQCLEMRAEALIAIADPAHQERLARAWHAMRKDL